jgi:hypothetical protein
MIDFSEIDTSVKAYFVGLALADGNISVNGYTFRLEWNIQDLNYLEKLSTLLKTTTGIKVYGRGSSHKNPRCRLTVCNKKFCGCLAKYGVVPKKTKDVRAPTNWLPKEFEFDFIRGYFDGDGGIWERGDRNSGFISKLRISIIGTHALLEFILERFNRAAYFRQTKGSEHAWELYCGGYKAYTILSKLYEKSDLCMPRKHNLYLKYKDVMDG